MQAQHQKEIKHLEAISVQKKHGDSKSPPNEVNDEFGNQDNQEDQWDDDELTTDAYSERMRELCEGLSNGNIMRDAKESANILFKFVKSKKEAGLLQDQMVQKEIVKEAERLDIRDKSVLIMSEILFSENIIEEIKANKILLLRFCYENKKAQKYLLGGFEKLVGDVYHDKLFNQSMKILKTFYDEDILDEETIIEWSQKESKKYVPKIMSKKIHEKVAPFITWLKEAEEDSSSEDGEDMASKSTNSKSPSLDIEDDEDDIELEFTHRAEGIQEEDTKPVARINPSIIAGHDEEKLDDDDIDNI